VAINLMRAAAAIKHKTNIGAREGWQMPARRFGLPKGEARRTLRRESNQQLRILWSLPNAFTSAFQDLRDRSHEPDGAGLALPEGRWARRDDERMLEVECLTKSDPSCYYTYII
jgi:hypothetical protein